MAHSMAADPPTQKTPKSDRHHIIPAQGRVPRMHDAIVHRKTQGDSHVT
jgi:hypothetical protein